MNTIRNEAASRIAEVLHALVQALVKNTSGVSVTAVVHCTTAIVSIQVDKGDVSRIIGKEGRHLSALRRVAREVATSAGMKVWVSVDETTPREAMPSSGTQVDITAVLHRALAILVNNSGLLSVDTTNIGSASLIEVTMSVDDEERLKGVSEDCDQFDPEGTVEGALGRLLHAAAASRGRSLKMILSPLVAD